eukprot:UN20797
MAKVKECWSILVDLHRKRQRIFSMHRSIYTEKVNGFLPTSVDSNTKSEMIVVNIGGFLIILFL